MRKIIHAVLLVGLLSSCKEKVNNPLADFRIFAANIECYDAIPDSTDGYLLFTGKSDMDKAVFFTGSGRMKNRYSNPTDTGASLDADKKVFFRYPTAGVKDTIVCIATIVNDAQDIKQDIKEKEVTIY